MNREVGAPKGEGRHLGQEVFENMGVLRGPRTNPLQLGGHVCSKRKGGLPLGCGLHINYIIGSPLLLLFMTRDWESEAISELCWIGLELAPEAFP